MSIKGFSVGGLVQRYDYTALDNLPQGQGVSDDLKAALLQLAQKVAYINDQGQTYYDDLYNALYPERTLLSITANFQQGQAVIYNTDSLDTLKQYLTVTAVYDDASTEIVPSSAYTLSGTLTAGTSVITVTYEGKTDAFNVVVTAAPMSFPVTNNLTGCTTSNSASNVADGSTYNAVITASSDYTLVGATVSITMGGQDITTSAYSGGVIAIRNVNGALVISVTAVERVLSSISAVYTQSGAVYDTDTLDSLKTDLVVTAHYSDSSTQTVPAADYTLSGTLTVGTSTITVSYGGKTTTFSVTVTEHVTPEVPDDYTTYDYIAYIGSNTNVAKTNIVHTAAYDDLNALVIECEWSPLLAKTSATAIMGGQSATGNTKTVAFYGRTDTKRVSAFSHGTAIGIDNNAGVVVGNVVSVKLDPGSASPSTLSVDDVDQTGAWTNQNTINAPLGYCGSYGTSTTNVSMYHFAGIGILKLTDLNGNLVGKYIPVKRIADNVLGIFDTVSQTFHTSASLPLVTEGGASCVWQVGNWGA